MCPKVPGSLLTYRARAGAPRSIANARRRGAPGVLVPVSVQAVALITALYLLAPPPPAGGRGSGGGGGQGTATKRPKGEGAPKGGAGRGRAAERGPGAHDSPRPERREPDPRGRAGPAHPEHSKTTQFC